MEMSKELKAYQDAVWDFILEHCDVTDRGSFFVKFHTDDRKNFERRIKARQKYHYHRADYRTGETREQKELRAMTLREEHKTKKRIKKERWQQGVAERKRILEEVKRRNERRQRSPRLYRMLDFIHTLYTSLTRVK